MTSELRGRQADPLESALDELRSEGFAVLDDLDVGRESVSHCIVGPTGVFAIEPEDWTGFVNANHHLVVGGHDETDEVERVADEAATVERLLHAAGVDRDVCGVIALTATHGHGDFDHVSVIDASELPELVRAPKLFLHADTVDHIRHVLSLYRHDRRRSA